MRTSVLPKFLPRKSLLALLVCASVSAWAANGGSTLEERMSYKEFREFGLDHLSTEQLRGLNAWLQVHGMDRAGSAVTATPGATSAPATQPPAQVDETIESRIAGSFNGWRQGTILTLENGQRWEVRDDETVYAHDESHPRVTIAKGGLIGGWRLSIDGRSDLAHVVPVTHP